MSHKKKVKKIVENIDIMEEDGSMSIDKMIELLQAQKTKYPDTYLGLEAYTEYDYYGNATSSHAKLTMMSREN